MDSRLATTTTELPPRILQSYQCPAHPAPRFLLLRASRQLLLIAVDIRHHNHLDTSFNYIASIDAKGIQQADEIERSHQVYQMGTIYSRASSICL